MGNYYNKAHNYDIIRHRNYRCATIWLLGEYFCLSDFVVGSRALFLPKNDRNPAFHAKWVDFPVEKIYNHYHKIMGGDEMEENFSGNKLILTANYVFLTGRKNKEIVDDWSNCT